MNSSKTVTVLHKEINFILACIVISKRCFLDVGMISNTTATTMHRPPSAIRRYSAICVNVMARYTLYLNSAAFSSLITALWKKNKVNEGTDIPIIRRRDVLKREKRTNSRSLEMLGDQTGNYKGAGEKMEIPKGRWLPRVSFVKSTKTRITHLERWEALPLGRGRR